MRSEATGLHLVQLNCITDDAKYLNDCKFLQNIHNFSKI